MSDNRKQTVIEAGTEFDGSVKSQCAITLSGILKGQLHAPALTITESGSVQGKVKVTALKSLGEVSGDIEAEEVVLSGRVNDQTTIRAKSLEVKLTKATGGVAVSFGNCELQVGDKPPATSEKHAKTEAEAHAGKSQKQGVGHSG
jgi:cytoskeletal protein CcmA (bactofilin family)